jgi:Holliday junction resolvase
MPVVSLIADNENIVITFEKKYKNYQELIDQKEKIEQLLNNKSLKYFKIRPNYEKISLEIIIYLKREND